MNAPSANPDNDPAAESSASSTEITTSSPAYEVFVSYAREDAVVAGAIVERLREWGINCWIDRDTIVHKPGEEWAEEIVAAIKQCRIMIVVFSRHANASKYVKSEVHKAFDVGLPIVPFRIEDVAPQGAYELHLPRSQWLDAFPRHEPHLSRLASTVCDLLARHGPEEDPDERPPRASKPWKAFLPDMLRRLPRWRSRSGSRGAEAPRAEKRRGPARNYRGRKAIREAASQENPRALAKHGRWWRIKELIDALTFHGMPLGQFAEAQPGLQKRIAAFAQVRSRAEEAITRLGSAKARPYVDRLKTIIADHPDIEVLEHRMHRISRDRDRLRARIEDLAAQNRWTAIENALRDFVLTRGQATRSILQAAEKTSAQARLESRRFRLIAWTVLAGAVVLGATYCVENWLGIYDGSIADNFSRGTDRLGVPIICVLARFATVVTVMGFMLAAFGVHHQGMFAGASIGLMVGAATVQAIPWAVSLLPVDASAVPPFVSLAIGWAPAALFAMALVAAVQFATCRLFDASPGLPGPNAMAAACLGAFGFIPTTGFGGSHEATLERFRWLPDGFLCAGLLAVTGMITRRGPWWLPVGFVIAAGVLKRDHGSHSDSLFIQGVPVMIGLIVAGWVATRPKTVRGYLVLLGVAVASCLAAGAMRGIDESARSLPPYGQLAPLLGLWGVACGTAAIKHSTSLGAPVRTWDMVAKQLLRLRAARSSVSASELAETSWFREGREWHAKHEAATESGSAPGRRVDRSGDGPQTRQTAPRGKT